MRNETCAECGRVLLEEEATEFEGRIYCPECLDSLTTFCRYCGDRIFRDDNEGSGDTPLCYGCYENYYTHCGRCGELIHNDRAYYMDDLDDVPYCEHCYHILYREPIHHYHYVPEFHFFGSGKRYFGVELEIDKGGEDKDNAKEILDVGNVESEHDRIYCKHDGSLVDGFEIVTHPMTLEYHESQMPWVGVCSKARKLGYYSHQTDTCGLHIHVNRDSLGDTNAQQEAVIGRIIYLVERYWNELLIFSRRTEYQLTRWACRYGYKDQPKEMLEHVKKGRSSRYTCVNLTNEETIEFRIFKGTLKSNTIIATLQLVNHLCDVAYFLSDEEARGLSWSRFVASADGNELIRYLKERRLYLNDPVDAEEEA